MLITGEWRQSYFAGGPYGTFTMRRLRKRR
jgi:hypothetical protein